MLPNLLKEKNFCRWCHGYLLTCVEDFVSLLDVVVQVLEPVIAFLSCFGIAGKCAYEQHETVKFIVESVGRGLVELVEECPERVRRHCVLFVDVPFVGVFRVIVGDGVSRYRRLGRWDWNRVVHITCTDSCGGRQCRGGGSCPCPFRHVCRLLRDCDEGARPGWTSCCLLFWWG